MFKAPLFTTLNDLESWAGLDGHGVHHKKIWSPDSQDLYGVLPEQYWSDFELTIMTINSMLLPHQDNDLITTINFYICPGDYRTVFYKPRDQVKFSQPRVEITGTEVPLEQQIGYVKAVYDPADVIEVSEFVAKPNEAYVLDVREIHNVIPQQQPQIRKVLALRTKKYIYDQVCNMLIQTGNL